MKKSALEHIGMLYGLVTAAVLALYLPGIKGTYYGDDVLFIFPRGHSLLYWFTHANPRNVRVYRPLEAAWLSFSQSAAGLSGVPVHVLSFTVHLVMALLIVHVLSRYFSRTIAGIAGILFAVSQVNVLAVMGIDTVSQSLNALFLLLTCLLFWRFCNALFGRSRREMAGFYVVSAACFFGALYSKESGVSAILGVTLIGSLMALRQPDRFRSLVRVTLWIVPLAVLTLLYLHMRSTVVQVPIQFGADNYAFKLGLNVPKNLAQIAAGILVPVSTVILYSAVKAHDLPVLVLIGVITVLFAGSAGAGLVLSLREKSNRAIIFVFSALAILGVFPFFLTNHISELYTYNAMPYAAALCGIGIGSLLAAVRRPPLQLMILIFLAAIVVSHCLSTAGKVSMMASNGDSAADLTRQVRQYIETLPSDRRVHLLIEPSFDEYSVFRMTGFKVVEYGLVPLPGVPIRDDVVVTIGESVPELLPNTTVPRVLHVVDDMVVPLD